MSGGVGAANGAGASAGAGVINNISTAASHEMEDRSAASPGHFGSRPLQTAASAVAGITGSGSMGLAAGSAASAAAALRASFSSGGGGGGAGVGSASLGEAQSGSSNISSHAASSQSGGLSAAMAHLSSVMAQLNGAGSGGGPGNAAGVRMGVGHMVSLSASLRSQDSGGVGPPGEASPGSSSSSGPLRQLALAAQLNPGAPAVALRLAATAAALSSSSAGPSVPLIQIGSETSGGDDDLREGVLVIKRRSSSGIALSTWGAQTAGPGGGGGGGGVTGLPTGSLRRVSEASAGQNHQQQQQHHRGATGMVRTGFGTLSTPFTAASQLQGPSPPLMVVGGGHAPSDPSLSATLPSVAEGKGGGGGPPSALRTSSSSQLMLSLQGSAGLPPRSPAGGPAGARGGGGGAFQGSSSSNSSAIAVRTLSGSGAPEEGGRTVGSRLHAMSSPVNLQHGAGGGRGSDGSPTRSFPSPSVTMTAAGGSFEGRPSVAQRLGGGLQAALADASSSLDSIATNGFSMATARAKRTSSMGQAPDSILSQIGFAATSNHNYHHRDSAPSGGSAFPLRTVDEGGNGAGEGDGGIAGTSSGPPSPGMMHRRTSLTSGGGAGAGVSQGRLGDPYGTLTALRNSQVGGQSVLGKGDRRGCQFIDLH